MEDLSFERPLVTDMNNVSGQRFNGIQHGWSHNEDDSMEELNTALDEALQDYDLATRWLDGSTRQQEQAEGRK